MERYHVIGGHLRLDPEGTVTSYDDAQRALDAEREKVQELECYRALWKRRDDELTGVLAPLATLQAQLRQVEGERDAFTRKYHESMGILSAWRNIDHAEAVARLLKTETDLATLRQLVAQLPVLDMRFDSVAVGPLGWTVGGVAFGKLAEANAYSALLQYRATLAAKDAGKGGVE